MDTMEQDAAKQADTVKSVVAKSKIWLTIFQKWRYILVWNEHGGNMMVEHVEIAGKSASVFSNVL